MSHSGNLAQEKQLPCFSLVWNSFQCGDVAPIIVVSNGSFQPLFLIHTNARYLLPLNSIKMEPMSLWRRHKDPDWQQIITRFTYLTLLNKIKRYNSYNLIECIISRMPEFCPLQNCSEVCCRFGWGRKTYPIYYSFHNNTFLLIVCNRWCQDTIKSLCKRQKKV